MPLEPREQRCDFLVHIHTELFVGIVYIPTNTLESNDVTRDFMVRVDFTCNITCMYVYMYMCRYYTCRY